MPSINPTHVDDEHWQHGFVFVDDAREVRIHYINCPPPSREEKVRFYSFTAIRILHTNGDMSLPPSPTLAIELLLRTIVVLEIRRIREPAMINSPWPTTCTRSSMTISVYTHIPSKAMASNLFYDRYNISGSRGRQDIGGMIAHAYAAQHPDHTRSVMWGECPLPGSKPYESGFKIRLECGTSFFSNSSICPSCSPWTEKIYIKHFYDRLCFNPTGITPRDVDHYAASFCQPGAMRAGFDLYRAFPQDAKDNQARLNQDGKSKVPAAALNGEMSLLLEVADEQAKQFYETTESVIVAKSGHWTAEENPQSFVDGVLSFIKKHD